MLWVYDHNGYSTFSVQGSTLGVSNVDPHTERAENIYESFI